MDFSFFLILIAFLLLRLPIKRSNIRVKNIKLTFLLFLRTDEKIRVDSLILFFIVTLHRTVCINCFHINQYARLIVRIFLKINFRNNALIRMNENWCIIACKILFWLVNTIFFYKIKKGNKYLMTDSNYWYWFYC